MSTVGRELRDRCRAFRARSLAEVRLLSLFLDAIVRHEAPFDRPESLREGRQAPPKL